MKGDKCSILVDMSNTTRTQRKFFKYLRGFRNHEELTIKVTFHKNTIFISIGTWANAQFEDEDILKKEIRKLNKALRLGLWKTLDTQRIFSKKLFMFDMHLPSKTFIDNGRAYLNLDYTLYKLKEEEPTNEEINIILDYIMDILFKYPNITYTKHKEE